MARGLSMLVFFLMLWGIFVTAQVDGFYVEVPLTRPGVRPTLPIEAYAERVKTNRIALGLLIGSAATSLLLTSLISRKNVSL